MFVALLAVLAVWIGVASADVAPDEPQAEPGEANIPPPRMRMAWPLCGKATSGFGYRVDPFTGRVAFHSGLDIANDFGVKIRAAHRGRVRAAERRGPYGLMVEIDGGDTYATRYGQLQTALVKPGDIVRRGEVIATVGSSGRSTGPHLHFEVWYKDRVWDPKRSLSRKVCGRS